MIIQLLSSHTDAVLPYYHAKPAIILLQNGVYAARKLLHEFPELQVYALENDWHASGLSHNNKVALITANQWVELCAMHLPVITIQNTN
jgi:sulfur relay protein TusB/DsrH